MLYKIRIVLLLFIIFILSFLVFNKKGNVELSLIKTLLPTSIENRDDIISISNLTASNIKVVFESNKYEKIDEIKDKFLSLIDLNYYEVKNPDFSNLVNAYMKAPSNFLSEDDYNLLENKKYNEMYQKSINSLYNPTFLKISDFDKDPYFLFDDFIYSNKKPDSAEFRNEKYYDTILLKIKNNEGLSPKLANFQISKLVKFQKELSLDNSKIYLAGAPVHSYYASRKSIFAINFICILSIILISYLTHKYFRNLKLLILIALSISFGMLAGYTFTRLYFNDFQIITMVFSSCLIGIGIDYSYHYFYSKEDKNFIKNLTLSLFTTIIPFLLLYFTKIELLEQISIFTIFGLVGIYLIVLFIYPCFDFQTIKREVNLPSLKFKYIFISLAILSLIGILRFNFNDDINSLYTPSGKLKEAEILYDEIAGFNNKNTQIITIDGYNFDEIIKKEEKITNELIKRNINYASLSKFLPSAENQKKNFTLVKELYKNNLDNFSNILSDEQINILKNTKFAPVYFNIDNFPYLKDFILDKNKSIIFVFDDLKLDFLNNNVKIINFRADIKNCIKTYREKVLFLLPVVIFILGIFLTSLYGFKKMCKILAPPFLGAILALFLTSSVLGEVNLFSIISIFLILGFTMDYSIFRISGKNNIESPIFISFLTTSFSFLLLSFSGFKLLSSISLMLFFGILISYLVGYFLFLNRGN